MQAYIAVSILCFALAAVLAASWIFSGLVLHPKRKSLSYAGELMTNEGSQRPGYYESLKKERFFLEVRGGKLSCELIPAHGDSTSADVSSADGSSADVSPAGVLPADVPPRVMILVHGYGFNRLGEVKYIPFFKKRGFNIIIYDNRNSGESFGRKTTMGFFEREDLSRVVTYARSRFGENAVIGLHGESMGGAIVLMCAARDERVSFVIADCAYSDCAGQLSHNLKRSFRLPRRPFIAICSLMTKLRAGFFYSEVSPIRDISGLSRPLPILFFHGTGDDFVPCANTERMFAAYNGPKAVFYGQGSRHTFTCVDYPEQYDAQIDMFLSGIAKSRDGGCINESV